MFKKIKMQILNMYAIKKMRNSVHKAATKAKT